MLIGGSRAVCRVVRSSMRLSSNTRQFEEPEHSEIYARFRPVAPSSIVEHILAFRGEETRKGEESFALDVGCGSGQFTRLLPCHFSRVMATDVSQAQVEKARRALAATKVEVEVGSGEQLEVSDGSLDLLTICQALHWLNLDLFYSEVERVLRPGGVLAVIGYHMTRAAPQCPQSDRSSLLRKHVDSGYLKLPTASLGRMERDDTRHYVESQARFSDWVGYIRTWSGLQTMAREKGQEEVDTLVNRFLQECQEILGVSEDLMSVNIPLRTQYWVTLYQK